MFPHHEPDDLSDIERRLSAWQPAAAGLDVDAMLYAAGRASAAPARAALAWTLIAASMLLLSLSLGGLLIAQRDQYAALAQAMHRHAPSSGPDASAVSTPRRQPETIPLPPDSYWAAHRALEQGLDLWHPSDPEPSTSSSAVPSSEPILQARSQDVLLGP